LAKKPERAPKKMSANEPKKPPGASKAKPSASSAKGGKGKEAAQAAAAESGPAKPNGKSAKEQLISLGKSKGFLTYDDVHEALPGDEVGPDQMDDVLSALDDEEASGPAHGPGPPGPRRGRPWPCRPGPADRALDSDRR
jgi:hypothetical protein